MFTTRRVVVAGLIAALALPMLAAIAGPGSAQGSRERRIREGNITAAEIVSPTKISVALAPTRRNGKTIDPTSPDAKPVTAVLEKVGNMIKEPSGPMLLKCVN